MERTYIKNLKDHIDQKVAIAGFVDVRRDHGKLIFIDLRDKTGVVQSVIRPDQDDAYQTGKILRGEWVVRMEGVVNKRPEKMINTEKTCSLCRSTDIRREGIDCGYTSAVNLDRPAGAKGRDEFCIKESCQDCGSMEWELQPIPCHICGGPGVTGHTTDEISVSITGYRYTVYGMPDRVNTCSDKCKSLLDKKVKQLIDEASAEGAYDE